MNFKKVLKPILISGALVMSFTVGAFAQSINEQISATLNKVISIRLDGNIVELKDVSGNKMYPITYQGRTYVPLRSISDLFNKPIDYDAEKGEVILGVKNSSKSLLDFKFWDIVGTGNSKRTKNQNELTFNSEAEKTTFKEGLVWPVLSSASSDTIRFDHNFNKQYSKLIFGVASNFDDVSFEVFDQKSNFSLDKKQLNSKSVTYFDVDISNVSGFIEFKVVDKKKSDLSRVVTILEPVLK